MRDVKVRNYYSDREKDAVHFDGRHLEKGSKDWLKYLKENDITNQADAAGCDINVLLKSSYNDVTRLAALQKANPQYGEFDSMEDFGSAMEVIAKANEQFEALGAKIRSRFNNDPAMFLEFMGNYENVDEMIKLGLAVDKRVMKDKEQVDAAKSAEKSKGNA